MAQLDETHDPNRQSWVTSANGHPDFPDAEPAARHLLAAWRAEPRGGIAIGDMILDLAARIGGRALCRRRAQAAGGGPAHPRSTRSSRRGRGAAGPAPRSCTSFSTRGAGSRWQGSSQLLLPRSAVRPASAGATSATTPISTPASITRRTSASMFRPGQSAAAELQVRADRLSRPASSIVPSGTPVRRPCGPAARDRTRPCRPSAQSDGSTTNSNWGSGSARATSSASRFRSARPTGTSCGFCLLNDWSARDIQSLGVPAARAVPRQELRDDRSRPGL